jgi:all-trans-retinol 13,14-reductase
MSINTQYDFVIVGSGMGGLTSALILSKNGYKVLVLEKNPQIGGALQVFSRDKCIFDTGVHYIGGLDKGENLYQLFKYLGIYDGLRLKSLDRDCFDLIRFEDGSSYKHGQGYDNFIKELVYSFPEEEIAIREFCDKMIEMCNYFPLYNINEQPVNSYFENPEILEIGAWDYVTSITKNAKLQKVLLGSGPLYAGDSKSTPLYVVALIMNSYIKGSYRLVDGGAQIAKQLVKNIRINGGEILKRKKVINAEYNDLGEIAMLICEDGSSYSGKRIISNMHPSITIDVFGKNKFRPAYRDRIQNLQNTVSSFMVYFSLRKNTFAYTNYNIYDYFAEDIWDTVDYDPLSWPQMLYTCTPASSKSDVYADSLCVMCYMSVSEVKEWENTFNTIASPIERGNSYEAFKKEKEELVIRKLELKNPGFRESIINVYSSTPLTYKDYLGTPDGSLYGVMKDFRNPISSVINTKTKIPNLYLTGQNIVFHGILGATIGAFVTCFNFVKYENLISEIKKANPEI